MSIWRSTPSVNASSAPVTSRRSTPTSSAKWLRVPAGTHTNGIPCAAAPPATPATAPPPPARRALAGQRGQVLAPVQDDGLDPGAAGPPGQPGARRLAVTRPRVDEQHGPARRISGPPAVT